MKCKTFVTQRNVFIVEALVCATVGIISLYVTWF